MDAPPPVPEPTPERTRRVKPYFAGYCDEHLNPITPEQARAAVVGRLVRWAEKQEQEGEVRQ